MTTVDAFTVLGAVVLVPALLAFGLQSFRRPVLLLAVYAAIIPYGSSISLPIPLPPPFHTASTFAGLVAATGIVVHLFLARGDRAPVLSRAVPMWMLFFGFATASALWSVDTGQTQSYLRVLASLTLLYIVTALVAWDLADQRWLEHGLVGSGAGTGIYALFLQATGQMHLTGAGWPRFQTAGGGGEGGDPNVTAAALLLPFVVAIHGAFRDGANTATRTVYLAAAALTGAAIMLTGSRGGLLGLAAAVISLAASDGRPHARALFLTVPVAILGVAFLLSSGFIQSRVQAEHSSGRTEIWQVGLSACPDVCVMGAGWGTFNRVFSEQVLQQPDADFDKLSVQSHSLWVRIIIETGVFGALLLVAALTITVRELMRLPHRLRGPPLAALMGVLVSQTFLANLDFKYFWMVLIYALMVTQASWAAEPPDAPIAPRRQDASLSRTG